MPQNPLYYDYSVLVVIIKLIRTYIHSSERRNSASASATATPLNTFTKAYKQSSKQNMLTHN